MNPPNETALVVHGDGGDRPAAASSSSGVVLDALPYVEHLDPNYENYALSLIEEELQHVAAEQIQRQPNIGGGGELGEHPSLGQLLPASAAVDGSADFGARAPLAAEAYASLAARREAGDDSAMPTERFTITRPDPMAEDGADAADAEALLSNLRTSVATSKIRLEQERLRLVNLEMHQQLETPARFTNYASQLETQYVNPTAAAVERQRRTVDGINATRMEEQTHSAGKLEGLARRWESLVDKNRRLGRALEGLEGEVEGLRAAALAKDGGSREGGMGVAEASKES
ncbi:hypothetical protein ACHAXT_005623 [Thalassiosira profunda]